MRRLLHALFGGGDSDVVNSGLLSSLLLCGACPAIVPAWIDDDPTPDKNMSPSLLGYIRNNSSGEDYPRETKPRKKSKKKQIEPSLIPWEWMSFCQDEEEEEDDDASLNSISTACSEEDAETDFPHLWPKSAWFEKEVVIDKHGWEAPSMVDEDETEELYGLSIIPEESSQSEDSERG